MDSVPSALMAAKAGLSLSLSRIQIEMPSRMAETRKGMRQPMALNASSPMTLRVVQITARAPKRPKAAEVCTQLVFQPRRRGDECSAT